MNNHTVFKFAMFFDEDFSYKQERYVVAETEEEAIEKFHNYLNYMAANGFQAPRSYSAYPVVEIDYVIC